MLQFRACSPWRGSRSAKSVGRVRITDARSSSTKFGHYDIFSYVLLFISIGDKAYAKNRDAKPEDPFENFNAVYSDIKTG
jgi:hypothetical protein